MSPLIFLSAVAPVAVWCGELDWFCRDAGMCASLRCPKWCAEYDFDLFWALQEVEAIRHQMQRFVLCHCFIGKPLLRDSKHFPYCFSYREMCSEKAHQGFHLLCEISQHLLDGLADNHGPQRMIPNDLSDPWLFHQCQHEADFWILRETSQQLLDGLTGNLVHVFMSRSGWVVITLVILWLLIMHHHQLKMFICPILFN